MNILIWECQPSGLLFHTCPQQGQEHAHRHSSHNICNSTDSQREPGQCIVECLIHCTITRHYLKGSIPVTENRMAVQEHDAGAACLGVRTVRPSSATEVHTHAESYREDSVRSFIVFQREQSEHTLSNGMREQQRIRSDQRKHTIAPGTTQALGLAFVTAIRYKGYITFNAMQ